MATNIHHNVSELSSAPVTGQPFNFHGILDTYLLPRVVAADQALLPGARLLWGVIRYYSCRDGRCLISDDVLAGAVGVQRRQFIRYCHQLETAGLLRTTLRDGKTPVRELLWDSRFAGKMRKTPVMEDTGGCLTSHGGVSSKTPLYKEEGSFKVVTRYKTPAIEKAVAGNAASSTERPRPPIRTDEEIIQRGRECGFPEHVIARDLERARQRRAKPQDERMVKAVELEPDLASSIPR